MAHRILHSRVWAAALAAGALAANALGGMEWGDWNTSVNPTSVKCQSTIINDNPGAVYDSYLVKLADLANQIWSNNPALHGTYSSAADLVANGVFTYGIDSKPTSEVQKGWNATNMLPNGDVQLRHRSSSFDTWLSSPGTNMQRGSLSVAKTFLDLDGDGWTTNDLRIGNDTNQVVVGGEGYAGFGNTFTDTIARIVVVLPEREVSISSTHAWFGSSEVGNPTGAGRYAYGSAVTVSVDRIVADPENPGRRLRLPGTNDFGHGRIGLSGNLAFGMVPTGASAIATMTIASLNFAPLKVTNIVYPEGFGGAWTGIVKAGSSTNVQVTFSPATAMDLGGSIIVQTDAKHGTNAINCSGSGGVFSNATARTVTGIRGCVVSADVDGDSIDELISCDGNSVGTYRYDEPTGMAVQLWNQALLGANMARFGDVDHDGALDMVVGRTTAFRAFKKSASNDWTQLGFFLPLDGYRGNRWLSIGDCDGDGTNEVVTGDGTFWYISRFSQAGSAFSRVYTDPGNRDHASMWVGDADNDGTNEIVVGTAYQTPYRIGDWRVWDNGVISSAISISGRQEVALADLDNDARNEVLVTTGDPGTGARLYRYDGTNYVKTWEGHLADSCWKPIIGAILNNGRNQFAFLAQGKLVVYEYVDGVPEKLWEQDLGPTMVNNWTQMELALGDPDHDGQTDLIVSRGYGLAPLLLTIRDTRGGGP